MRVVLRSGRRLTEQSSRHSWKTYSQLMEQYKDKHIVDDLCSRKKQSGDFMQHPEMPDRPDCTLYYAGSL